MSTETIDQDEQIESGKAKGNQLRAAMEARSEATLAGLTPWMIMSAVKAETLRREKAKASVKFGGASSRAQEAKRGAEIHAALAARLSAVISDIAAASEESS